MPHNDIINETYRWFTKAVPEPVEQNFTTQLGVHCEEFGEMLDELKPISHHGALLLQQANLSIKALARELKEGTADIILADVDRKLFFDAMMDQIVTATGTCRMANMKPVGGLKEVNRSNYSKFVKGEPIFNENLKIMKGPDYSPPDLTPFI